MLLLVPTGNAIICKKYNFCIKIRITVYNSYTFLHPSKGRERESTDRPMPYNLSIDVKLTHKCCLLLDSGVM